MIQLYTIGFTGKTAEQFFTLLKKAGVEKIIDTRINNVSQLAGFAKGTDLQFFAKAVGGMDYEHVVDFAPTKELLSRYRDKEITWEQYEAAYLALLDQRKVAEKTPVESLHKGCLLCSEHTPDKCHRRLLAEYLVREKGEIEVIHLVE